MGSNGGPPPSWVRRHRSALLIAGGGLATVLVARAYVTRRPGQRAGWSGTLAGIAALGEAVASSGETLASLVRDVSTYLAAEPLPDGGPPPLPASLARLAALATSQPVQDALSTTVESMARGLMAAGTGAPGANGQQGALEQVLEALLSDRGATLVSLAVRAAAQSSSEAFCAALLRGLEAALAPGGVPIGRADEQQQQQQWPEHGADGQVLHQQQWSQRQADTTSPLVSSPLGSPSRLQLQHAPSGTGMPALQLRMPHHHDWPAWPPSPAVPLGRHGQQPAQQRQQQQQLYGSYVLLAQQAHASGSAHPIVAAVAAALGSPALLAALDGIVSTAVGSAVSATVSRAGPEALLSGALDVLGRPANKALVIDIMTSVSAAFCREMAAACIAPAADVVASRPVSRLAKPDLFFLPLLRRPSKRKRFAWGVGGYLIERRIVGLG